MHPKICMKLFGIIPRYALSVGSPVIVCVLPHPVCPYANIVPLYPPSTLSTKGNAVSSYIDYYSQSSPYTASNAKDFPSPVAEFMIDTSFLSVVVTFSYPAS